MFNIIEFRLNVSIQLFEIVLKIPPNLPLPKGGENYPPFDKLILTHKWGRWTQGLS
jgi:hypothetical protein